MVRTPCHTQRGESTCITVAVDPRIDIGCFRFAVAVARRAVEGSAKACTDDQRCALAQGLPIDVEVSTHREPTPMLITVCPSLKVMQQSSFALF